MVGSSSMSSWQSFVSLCSPLSLEILQTSDCLLNMAFPSFLPTPLSMWCILLIWYILRTWTQLRILAIAHPDTPFNVLWVVSHLIFDLFSSDLHLSWRLVLSPWAPLLTGHSIDQSISVIRRANWWHSFPQCWRFTHRPTMPQTWSDNSVTCPQKFYTSLLY